jgi:hypothetical protein
MLGFDHDSFSLPKPQPRRVSLLNLPNDILFLILEHFSPTELIHFHKFVQFSSSNSTFLPTLTASSEASTDPHNNLLRIFRRCQGQLFQSFDLDPATLEWLFRFEIGVSKLHLINYDDCSHKYLKCWKQFVQEIDFHASPRLLNKYLNQLNRCPALTSLSLAFCIKLNENTVDKFLKQNPQLERLNLSFTHFTKQILHILINNCPNLKYLDVSRNSWFDHHCLQSLVTSFPQLESINISHTSVRLNSVIEFLKLKSSIVSIGCDGMALATLDTENRNLLMQLSLRSVMLEDKESRKHGLENLYLLLQGKAADNLSEMIQSTAAGQGVITRLIQSLSHPVRDLPLPLPSLPSSTSFFSLFSSLMTTHCRIFGRLH